MTIALSYSRLSTYEQCPLKFMRQYITKDYPDDSDNPYFIKGQKKHKQFENYILCKHDPTRIEMRYDGDVQRALPIVDGLLANGFSIRPEVQLAVDEDFVQTSWFSKKVMYRAIVDVYAIRDNLAINGDWKTGKYRDYDGSSTGQLHLSSLMIMCGLPHIEAVQAAYFFIESKQTVERQFTKDMAEDMKRPFIEAYDKVNAEREWAPIKNPFCNWCLIKTQLNQCPLF